MNPSLPNPLLQTGGLPLFDQIKPEHVNHAIDELLISSSKALELVTASDFPSDWQAISKVLDVCIEKLGTSWGAVSHLNHVADTPELRAAYNDALPKVTEFLTRLGSDERLYAKYKAVNSEQLDAPQKQALRNALRNFVLGGADLQGNDKTRYAAIQERMAELSQKFSENALDATDRFSLFVSEVDLAGVPQDVIQAARTAAEKDGKEGYKLSLKMPCYLPVMQFATSSDLRQRLYRAYVTRASDQTDAEFASLDNSELIQEILQLRQEEALLLGYQNYAEISVATKMADSPAKVISFLRDLSQRARPFAEKDLADMRKFASEHLNLQYPQAWDWPYIGEKLKEARYSFSEQEVKQYFTAPKVLQGLFKIIETLFEVNIQADKAPVWHPAVSFYRIERNGQLVGQFYLDQPARWLRPDNGQLQTPVAHLVCNFAEGVDGNPALLTHDDVITLFHEFGHGLHHMLTQVNERDVSGISGVEWDAVELPSQFMENFCWEWSVLKHMTSHITTGAPLPRELFDKLVAAKNFQSGLQTLRQIELALLDMLLHSEHNPAETLMPVLEKVRAEVAVIQAPAFNRWAHTFSHIFAGGYAAGYYSYKWAEVLSADAYAAFEETAQPDGSPSLETGRRYREAILEAGGSRPALESFIAFRGREPSINALLRHQGMAAN
jgi:oligopeptidase A